MVSQKFSTHLPIFDDQPIDENEPSCSPKIYVSNEESALLAAMRDLRERAVEIRDQLNSGSGPSEDVVEEIQANAATHKMFFIAHLRASYGTRSLCFLCTVLV